MNYIAILAGLLTLATWSFLYKENPVFRLAEHLMIGISSAYMFVGELTYLRDYINTTSIILWIWPVILGLMLYFFFSRNYNFLYRIPMGFIMGIGSAITIRATGHGILLPQMTAMLRPILVPNSFESLNNLIIFVGTITTLTFFIFTRENSGALKFSSRIGRIFLMITFGATFGRVAMTRFATDIDRVKYLVTTDAVWLLPIFFGLVAVGIYLDYLKKSKQSTI